MRKNNNNVTESNAMLPIGYVKITNGDLSLCIRREMMIL